MKKDETCPAFREMQIGGILLKKIKEHFFTYPSSQSLFCEIISYFSYQASQIIFSKFESAEGVDFLCISGDDGGLKPKNMSVLTSINLGESSEDNISYFGAGARTACRQWTNDCKNDVFGICDNKQSVVYSTNGALGLEVTPQKADWNIYKDKYGLVTKENYTYWMLPWNEKIKNEIGDDLKAHFKFMYNKRLFDDLKINFFGEDLKPKINLFENSEPNTTDNILNDVKFKIDTYSNHIFAVHNTFHARLIHTRVKTNVGAPNKSGDPGVALKITNNANVRKIICIKKPGRKGGKELAEDLTYSNWGAAGWENDFNEEFKFSFEVMKGPNEAKTTTKSINPRRELISNEFKLGNAGSNVHGIRYLMGSNFITNKGPASAARGCGDHEDILLNIFLTKEQYKLYAKPDIKRTANWDCCDNLKKLADELYKALQGIVCEWDKKVASEQKIQTNELKEAKKKEKREKYINEWKCYTDEQEKDIIKIQSIARKNSAIKNVDNLRNEMKIQTQLAEDKKNKEIAEKARNRKKYIEGKYEWEEKQERMRGCIYIRSTKNMRKIGNTKFGKPIIKLGKSATGHIDNRRNQYLCHEFEPIEEIGEEWKRWTNVYKYDQVETECKRRMNGQGLNLRDKTAEGTIKGEEFYVATREDIEYYIYDEMRKKDEDLANDRIKKLEYLAELYPY